MKKISIYLLFTVIFFAFACNSGENKDNENGENTENVENDNSEGNDGDGIFGSYGIKSGLIEYEMNMMGAKTKMTTYFKKKGTINCTDLTTDVMGTPMTIRTLTLKDYVYILNKDLNFATSP